MEYFRPEHARQLHLAQTAWLEGKLIEMFDGPTVVITHYLPHRHSIHPKYKGDRLNPAFASDLSRLVRPPVKLWIHGHTHESFNYVVNGTRLVCNPRGYLPMEPNPAFNPRFVVEAKTLRITVATIVAPVTASRRGLPPIRACGSWRPSRQAPKSRPPCRRQPVPDGRG